jgi:hypothetical protein
MRASLLFFPVQSDGKKSGTAHGLFDLTQRALKSLEYLTTSTGSLRCWPASTILATEGRAAAA